MLRIIAGALILSSCSLGVVKSGGEHAYVYDVHSSYTRSDLEELSGKVVETQKREPQWGKLEELFGKGQRPLKRVGIIVFESEIQPTRSGLAGSNQVYLSSAGKQIMTEDFLSIWEQSSKVLAPDIDFVSTQKIKKSQAYLQYGVEEDDFVKTKRSTLQPDDIFFLDSGKKATTDTVLNPRGMRDMALLLVPAYELMGGPKWSEQHKHFVNDVSKSLKLDAVIIVMSKVSWSAAHTDKHSGEVYAEEVDVKIEASTLLSLSDYHERLRKLKSQDLPGVTLCYRSYRSQLKSPILLSLPKEAQNFESIEKEVLAPVFKTYKDLSQMTLMRIVSDLKQTWE